MTLFVAYNSALSATTAIAAGTSYTTGPKVALQLAIPLAGYIELVEWGISMDGSAAATPALLEVASTATPTTAMTSHTTTTVNALTDRTTNTVLSRLTMNTGATAFGAVTLVSNTTIKMADRQYVAPTNQYVKIWPLGNYPLFGNGTAAEYVQFRINATATVNAIVYAVWNEHI